MRFQTAVALAAAVAPLAVSAKGTLGYCLGVRHGDASCKNQADFAQDFKSLTSTPLGVKVVRTYAAIDGGANSINGPSCTVYGELLAAAKAAGVQVLLGLWADTDAEFDADSTETLKYVQEYKDVIYGFTVGSEGLYRDEQKAGTGYSASDILTRINKFKASLSAIGVSKPVGTADSWNKYQDGTADPLITGGVNFFLVNSFGYWQAQDITNASHTYFDDLQQAYGHIQSVAGGPDKVELWNGETGWPTNGGTDYGAAHAGTDNAQTFWKEGVCGALDWDFNVFYFEAFNEPWKPASTGLDGQPGDETHWGAFDKDRNQVIPDLSCNYP